MISLNPDEEILAMVRKHWIILARDIIIVGAIITAPGIVFGSIFILPFSGILNVLGIAIYLWVFLGILWVLLLWIILFIAWTNYYLDILIITNQRIYNIEQMCLFHRHSSTFRLDRLQDVTIEIEGIIQTLFKCGHIYIQTAGEQQEFIACYIPNPYKVKELIMQQHEKAMKMRFKNC